MRAASSSGNIRSNSLLVSTASFAMFALPGAVIIQDWVPLGDMLLPGKGSKAIICSAWSPQSPQESKLLGLHIIHGDGIR